MGAFEHGKRGNQLLEEDKWAKYTPEEDKAAPNMGDMTPTGNVGKPGLGFTNEKPQLAANDTAAHVTGLDDGADSFFGYNPKDYDETKYKNEKQLRTDALQYKPSNNFQTLVDDGLKFAQDNLNNAKQLGDTSLIKKYEEEAGLYQTVKDMYTNISPDSTFRYYQMEEGLRAVESLLEKYTGEMDNAAGLTGHDAAEKLTMIKEQLIDINRGMNVVGEAYLDDIDEKYKKGVISKQDYDTAYKEYYQAVIDRESTIQIPNRSLNVDNLTMADAATGQEFLLFDMLKAYDIPLYSTKENAVFAFKKEAMPSTLQANKEHSAVLNAIDLLDEDTGKVNTYYYFDVKQGADRDVVFNAILSARGGEGRMLLHTHPVDGYWSRDFSGNPDGSEMGDTSVPTTLGYGGIYVVTSGAEVKLHKGPGFANIGSGHSTYANTLSELKYASTIDLY